MAEGVLFNIAEGIIGRLGSLAFQEIGLIFGVKDELQKLADKVYQLHGVLLDAEQNQANNIEVKRWLERVEDAIYEADDVLDEFHAEAQWRQVVLGGNELSKKVRIFFSSSNQVTFGLKMGHKIKDINKKLDGITSNRTFNGLEVNHEDTRFIVRERVTHSFVPEEIIIGRDEDKKAIIQHLLDPSSAENVSTISVVGLGGLGKTALAQLVFNDKAVQNHFELKIWVCVSNVFQLDILVKKILNVDNGHIDQLQKDLRTKVDGKRYLLVLDDVWNDNREKWLSLKYLLVGGAKGSRILITTRSETVAMTSDATKSYPLRGLDKEQSWSLFKEMAFKGGKEPDNSTIIAAGHEIATKCRGVPLAIRTIGGMLRTKPEEHDWLNFKNRKLSKISQNENDILPTLKLSYDVLPSHLKHCFAYCSLFPPDYEISIGMLIKLWVAQGFVKSSDENECLEDIGHEYFTELLFRSFFQEVKKDEFGTIESCKMHDLMNELAVSVSGDKSTIIHLNQTPSVEKKHRHVSFDFNVTFPEWKVPIPLLKSNKMRTFLFLPQRDFYYKNTSFSKSYIKTIASNFKSLRMLSLKSIGIIALPKCLSKMRHLRYLDLSYNRIKRLPNWIVKLQNLETLNLSKCRDLVELPENIGKLINLRHLMLEDCYKLARIPRGLGELTRLRTLSRFVLSENNSMLRRSAGLGELGRLNQLRGDLLIKNLRHGKDVMSKSNHEDAVLKEKHLTSLKLWWIKNEDVDMMEENDVIKSMESLQPHSSLKQLIVLIVRGYRGVRFASWLPSLNNIVNLTLSDCYRCQHLPPLDHLPSLKCLRVYNLENLECISDQDWSTWSTPFFPSLETLYLEHCPNLKGWWKVQSSDSSSSTAHLSLPLPSFPCLSSLHIHYCPNLTSMPLYPNLEQLKLHNTSWKVLPSSLVTEASDITDDVHASSSSSISSSPLSKLKYLDIIGLVEDALEGIGNLQSLQELSISDCSNLASLPEGIGNLQSLQELRIKKCNNLASLPEGIGNLQSLQELRIKKCNNLASLPEGIGRLASLRALRIRGCHLLQERCKKETGEDWYKIAHIPNLTIEESVKRGNGRSEAPVSNNHHSNASLDSKILEIWQRKKS